MDTAVSVELFVEILNRYVYYFDQQNEAVSAVAILVIYSNINTDNDEIPQRTHRIDPFKCPNQPRVSNDGSSKTSLPAYNCFDRI